MYNRANVVNSGSYTGGIVGNPTSGVTLKYVYNAGKVIGSSYIGPISGSTDISASNWYYLANCYSTASNYYGISKTDTDLKSSTMISNLGGSSYWKQVSNINTGYPILVNNAQSTGVECFQVGTANTDFKINDATLNPNNVGINSTVAHTILKIDLTDISSSYSFKITVNASISSETNCDIGYATVNTTSSVPAYNTTAGRFMYISGSQSASDYSTTISGGSIYFLHLGYRKDGSVHGYNSNASNENFTINSVSITPEITSSTNTNAWDGSVNTSWYNTSSTSFNISTPQQLAGLAQLVNNGNTFEGKTINLTNNIDLNNREWTPIGIQKWDDNVYNNFA